MLPEEADIEAVIAAAPGHLGSMALLAKLTGLRQNEIVTLEWSQVDVKRQALNLTRTKTDRPRSVPLVAEAAAIIAGSLRHITSPYVFWVAEGDKVGPQNNVAGRFAELVRRVERDKKAEGERFRRFRFHDLRHWYAVDHLRQGGSIYRLQKFLGHTSISTTEIYLDYLTPDEAEQSKPGTAQPAVQGDATGTVDPSSTSVPGQDPAQGGRFLGGPADADAC